MPSKPSSIYGKRIAITGTLLFYRRAEAFSQIADRGDIPQKTVTRETDHKVVGLFRNNYHRDKSRKQLAAEKYIDKGSAINILQEDDFLRMLWSSPLTNEGG